MFASHCVRCDGNSEEATAFGGPLYYGHSPAATPARTCSSDEDRDRTLRRLPMKSGGKVAVMPGKWMDEHGKMKVPGKEREKVPGLSFADMAKIEKNSPRR
ncbi:MAG: hypothetical protein U0792_04325 [Gemmataceae bacterium]